MKLSIDFISICVEKGIKIHSVAENISTDTPAGMFMVNCLLPVNQYAVDNIRSIVKGGLTTMARSGLVYRSTSGQTMGLSLWLGRCDHGWQDWVCKRCLSSLAAPGRTATSKASMVNSEMNCLMVRSFPVCRRRTC
jgi:DNA invertase Pin-like site-specific DNA recombinase